MSADCIRPAAPCYWCVFKPSSLSRVSTVAGSLPFLYISPEGRKAAMLGLNVAVILGVLIRRKKSVTS